MNKPVDDGLIRYDVAVSTIESAIRNYLDVQQHNAVLVWQHDGCIFEPWDNTRVLAIRIARTLRDAGLVK